MFQALLINYYSQLNNQQSSNCHSCRTMIFVAAVTAVLQGHLLVTYLCYKYKLIPMSEGLVLWLNVNTRPEVPWEDMLYSELSPETALLTTASVCQGEAQLDLDILRRPPSRHHLNVLNCPCHSIVTVTMNLRLDYPVFIILAAFALIILTVTFSIGRSPVIAILYWLRIVVVRLYLMKRESTYILTLKSILKNSAVIHKHLLEKMFLVEKDTVSCSCYCDVVVWQYLIRRQ